MRLPPLGCATVALGLLVAAQPVAAADVDFASKTIRVVINFTAGGPSDVFMRFFQPWLEKKVPGRPTIIVENRVGAGGRVGANYVYNVAKPDGLTIGFLTAAASQGMLGDPKVKFDPVKFRWLGAVSQTQVMLARKELGIKAPKDLLKPGRPLVMGGTGLNGINDLNSALFLRMIGAKYKHVVGYRGQAEVMQALRRGEVNLADAGITAYLPNRASWDAEGLFAAILQRGVLGADGTFHRHPTLPALPTMAEAIAAIRPAAMKTPQFAAFRALVGTYNVQFALVLPPGTDAAITDTLAKAVAATFNDPDARRSAIKRFKVDYDFSDGPTAQRYVEQLFKGYNADPAIARVVQALLKSG